MKLRWSMLQCTDSVWLFECRLTFVIFLRVHTSDFKFEVQQNPQTLLLFLCWPQFVKPGWPMAHFPMRCVVCLTFLTHADMFVLFTHTCSFGTCSISMQMSLIFSAGSLADIHPPCVLQSFVNHGAVLHKVFVVGDRHFCVERPSLKNFPSGPCS